ncbi:MAG TPA: glycosyltransferase [Chthoniobacterales bacterium]|jgi:glycosyltransferase involved in cell wall biosynthesis|nr:glycosyltransferase [Chthoniobacterales bacterium]
MKLGLVTPWVGRDLKGGAEQQAWQIATRLSARGHSVEVLTTCCRSHQDDWATNHLPQGRMSEREGFAIRRFRVDARDRPAFDRVCGYLLNLETDSLQPGVPPVSLDDARIFAHELIKSSAMMAYLREQQAKYDSFLFLPYLYGPVLEGVQIVGDRAVLQPCLHDEAYAYLPQVADAFYRARLLFFNSEGEQELALRLFGPGIRQKSRIIGEGVEVGPLTNGTADSGNGAANNGRYLLYLGRKDPGKNVPLLLRAFGRFRAVRPNSTLKLILAGTGDAGSTVPDAIDAGLVSNEHKEKLLRDCVALVQPSRNESYSRAVMEAWLHGKPVAVHKRCPATAIPVKRTGGGWIADSEEDWARLFIEMDRTTEARMREAGENGKRYAEVEASWDVAMDRYEAALGELGKTAPPTIRPRHRSAVTINQFLPNLSHGDAISNHAIWIRDELRRAGFRSEIFVQFIDPRVANECSLFSVEALQRCDGVIYHHSIGAEMTPHLISFPGAKCLIYHNITPGEFFEPYRPEFARILTRGRNDLSALARDFSLSVGVSRFNAEELAERGFQNPGVLPLAVDPAKWALHPDPALMTQLQDGRTNILFVGRFAPNKKQDDLIRAFAHYLNHDPQARLFLVGKPEQHDPYAVYLEQLIRELDLAASVVLPGLVGDEQLAAYYRTAHLFWSMSEHEGFCVPLIEAMWFDVPIFAFKSSAVPETLGEAALMFTDKGDLVNLAGFAHTLLSNEDVRGKLIGAQRDRRSAFLPERVRPILETMVDKLCAQSVRVSR